MPNDPERFRKMVEESQDWFWEFDEHAVFTYVSPRIRDLLGYEPEELIGLNAFALMSPEEAERVHKHFDPLAKKYLPFQNLENINLHKDGREVVIESSGTPIFDEGGEFRGYRGIDRDITERRRVEEELRESRSKLQNILDTSSEWIWEMDPDGRHTYSNQRLQDLLGYSRDEFLGKQYSVFLHEEDLREVTEVLPRLMAQKKGWAGWVLRWRHKNGSYRFLESNAQPIFNSAGEVLGYRGTDRDITERQHAEDALRASQALLAQTQQLAKVGSWQFDLLTETLTWSEETYRIFGLSPEDFTPSYEAFLDMVHPEDRAEVESTYAESLQKGKDPYEVDHRIILPQGEIRYLHEKCRHELDADGAIIRSTGMVQDITERKLSEVALLVASQAAQAADRAKSLFLAKVSHEIRTPLTSIVGFGELLEDTDLDAEQKKYLDLINASSNSLLLLINDILDLSKIEAGELLIKQVDFSLHDFITKLVSMQKQKMAHKNLVLNVNVDSDVPDALVGDPLRIEQLLLNLLDNAVKFTQKGAIGLAFSVEEESGDRVLLEIAVQDTGIGISADLLKHIFKPFVQGTDAPTAHYNGAGLGLAISLRLADLMGGTIRVESQQGAGSTFRLLIPLQRRADGKKKPHKQTERSQWRGATLKILLAEDNAISAQFIKTVLENLGHAVTVVENGLNAFEALSEDPFDLVLMDIQMPVMDGPSALSALRDLEKISGKHQLVIALTAYALIGDQEKYLNLGFDGYLSKPFTTRALLGEIERVVPV